MSVCSDCGVSGVRNADLRLYTKPRCVVCYTVWQWAGWFRIIEEYDGV